MFIPSSLGKAASMRNGVTLLISICAVGLSMASVSAEAAAVDDKNAKCLACHSMGLKKSLADGEHLSLQVSADSYKESVHGRFACTTCHRDVSKSKHPAKVVIENKRTYSVSQNEVCKGCHKAMFTQYAGSIHASLSTTAASMAPVCTDCHNVHSIQPVDMLSTLTGEPCKACHEAVFSAYAESVHGTAREHGNKIRQSHIEAPICADCHSAHDVSAVAAGDLIQATCKSCHENTSMAHAAWLPNSTLHLDNIACAACHSPLAERRVDLELYDNVSARPLLMSDESLAAMLREIDVDADGLDPIELWTLVRQFSRDGEPIDVSLRGRLEVKTGGDAHRLAAKDMAVRQCEHCHMHGSESFKTVMVSVKRADGRRQHLEARSEVLDAVSSVGSVRQFYATGGTRIGILDDLFVLSIAFGMAVPLGHMGIRRFLKNRSSKEK